jgi:dsRNA-specific ribonuclease
MLKDSVDYKTMLQELMHKINHKAVEYRVHQDKTSHEFTAEI